MTIHQVRARVNKICELRADDELAHKEEDALHQDLLKHLLTMDLEMDQDAAKEMIKEALETLDIDFARWCA